MVADGDTFEWVINLFLRMVFSSVAQFWVFFTVGRSTPCLHSDGRWVNLCKQGH